MNEVVEFSWETSLPWLEPAWERLMAARQAGRLAHGLLVAGPPGVGKAVFAHRLAAILLCEPTGTGTPCGECRACNALRAGHHPDLLTLSPTDKGGRVIRVDQIRELRTALALTSHYDGWRAVIIDPADRMNPSAANALLKTLEEPTPATLLILVSADPQRLPATIRSRCQKVPLSPPPFSEGLAWLGERVPAGTDSRLCLRLAGGAPLHALEIAQAGDLQQYGRALDEWLSVVQGRRDPIALAEKWSKEDLGRIVDWLTGWVADMIRIRQGVGERAMPVERGHDLRNVVEALDCVWLFERLDELYRARRLAETTVNSRLFAEDLLLSWDPGQRVNEAR